MSQKKYICRRCGNNVQYWYFGWKHCTGWHSPPSCGQRPDPVEVKEVAALTGREAG